MKYKTKDMKKGERAHITWKIPNILATGTYDISIACCDQSVTEFYDWYNQAATFIISKEGNTAGVVDPGLSIEAYSKS